MKKRILIIMIALPFIASTQNVKPIANITVSTIRNNVSFYKSDRTHSGFGYRIGLMGGIMINNRLELTSGLNLNRNLTITKSSNEVGSGRVARHSTRRSEVDNFVSMPLTLGNNFKMGQSSNQIYLSGLFNLLHKYEVTTNNKFDYPTVPDENNIISDDYKYGNSYSLDFGWKVDLNRDISLDLGYVVQISNSSRERASSRYFPGIICCYDYYYSPKRSLNFWHIGIQYRLL